MKAFDIIRLMGGEFAELPDDTIRQWIEIMRPMVSRKQFGKLYEQALAFLVCHKLKMGGQGENPLGPLGNIGVGFALGSVSEGGSSISFGAGQSSNLEPDAELALTSYGVQYLSLRRMVIVPIHISGEQDFSMSGCGSGRRRRTGTESGSTTLQPASDSSLGGVRVKEGSGLTLGKDGALSVDVEGILAELAGGGEQP